MFHKHFGFIFTSYLSVWFVLLFEGFSLFLINEYQILQSPDMVIYLKSFLPLSPEVH